MHRKIILQYGRIKTNEERFDLSIKDKPVKPPIWKMQQLEIGDLDLGETNFVVKRMTRATTKSENLKNKWGLFSMNLEVKPLNTKNREKL